MDDKVFATEQFLSLLRIDSNRPKQGRPFQIGFDITLERFNMSFDYGADPSVLVGRKFVDFVDHHRVPLTFENAQKMSGTYSTSEEQEEAGYGASNWNWVDFLNQHFDDCAILRVPFPGSIHDFDNCDWDCCWHENFIVGRMAGGHLIGFCACFFP